jgi:hypothetical protein
MKPPPPAPVSGLSVTHEAKLAVPALGEHACARLGGERVAGCDRALHVPGA